MKPKTLKVRAGNGIRMPLPESVIVDSAEKVLTDSNVIEVFAGSFVRKRIKSGDMVEVKASAKTKPSKTKAEA